MSRCIQSLVEKELVHNYQRDSTPDEETRNALEKIVGTNWREDQGVVGGSYIMQVIKEGWIQNLRAEH